MTKMSLVVLLIGFCAINIAAEFMNSQVTGQNNLLNFLVRSLDVSNKHPQRSMDCFSYYIPILNEIAAEYQRSYAVCLQTSINSKCLVDKSTQDDRNSMESTAQDACQLLFDCSQLKNSIDYFECYVERGAQNSKTMYSISTNASVVLFKIREEYRLIENEEFRCTNASERAYVEQTSKTHNDLQSCLLGVTPVPTVTNSSVNLPQAEVVATNNIEASAVIGSQAQSFNTNEMQHQNIKCAKKKVKRPDKLQ